MDNEDNLVDGDLIYVREDNENSVDQVEYLNDDDTYQDHDLEEQEELLETEHDDLDHEHLGDELNGDMIECSNDNQIEDIDDGEDQVVVIEEKAINSNKEEGLMVVDEWDENEFESEPEDETEKDKDAINPEDIERTILNMPSLKSMMDDIGHLKMNRKVLVSPLSIDELQEECLKEVLTWSTCEEVKYQSVRPFDNPELFKGILSIQFTTPISANKASELLKTWKEDINIKVENNTNQSIEDFINNTRGKKRWSDNVVVLKNLTDQVTQDILKELFQDVEDIVVHKDAYLKNREKEKESSKKDQPDKKESGVKDSSKSTEQNKELEDKSTTEAKESSDAVEEVAAPNVQEPSTNTLPLAPAKCYAFIFCSSDIVAAHLPEEIQERKIELFGHRIYGVQYRPPASVISRHYLKLKERKTIMKHLDKLVKSIEKAKDNPSFKLPDKVEERVEKCKNLIEKDNKCRKEMGLPEYTIEELKKMSGLPVMSQTDNQRILIRYGIIKEKKKKNPPSSSAEKKHKDGRSNSRKNDTRNNNRSRKGALSPRRPIRRSPYNRKRQWENDKGRGRGGYNSRDQRGTGLNNSIIGNPGLVNSLAMMMQPNLGLMGSNSLLNPMLMQQNMMMNSGGIMNAPYLGLGMQNTSGGMRSIDDQKVIRLDETGNFRSGRDQNRYSDRDRFDNRDRRRQRSRTPDKFSRGGTRGMGSGDIKTPEVNNPVNLLLNLSQMLSQKMEQKRQLEQDKRGSNYDRDYRSVR